MKKLFVSICAMVVLVGSLVVFAAPGTEDDPLVARSYLEKAMAGVRLYVDDKVASGGEEPPDDKFHVVEVAKGETLIAGEGTELIVRMGGGKIVATPKGGIANVTSGWDLADGSVIPSNSLLIVPLADGRGLKAESDMLVMVKGSYEIID